MQIPILNIYYLLCYAWNKLEERDVVNVEAKDALDIQDLFARVLISGVTYLFKRGLDRGYQTTEENSQRIKGKILFEPTIKHNLCNKSFVWCQFDELDYNVLHNKILKTTIRKLISLRDLDNSLKDELTLLYRRFPPINDIEIKSQLFRLVRLNRNNFFYDFLLKICEIIHHNLLIDEKTGDYKFLDFLRDEKQMNRLFEDFVRNFYIREQAEYKVKSEIIPWDTLPGPSDNYLPNMKTDISLESKKGDRKIVIDTKYYSKGYKTIAQYGDQEKLLSSNLYQIYAYMKNLENCGGCNGKCEGILLYAAVEDEADHAFWLPGHVLRIKTINLNQDWKQIGRDLKSIIGI